jgi:hypothetical protein
MWPKSQNFIIGCLFEFENMFRFTHFLSKQLTCNSVTFRHQLFLIIIFKNFVFSNFKRMVKKILTFSERIKYFRNSYNLCSVYTKKDKILGYCKMNKPISTQGLPTWEEKQKWQKQVKTQQKISYAWSFTNNYV